MFFFVFYAVWTRRNGISSESAVFRVTINQAGEETCGFGRSSHRLHSEGIKKNCILIVLLLLLILFMRKIKLLVYYFIKTCPRLETVAILYRITRPLIIFVTYTTDYYCDSSFGKFRFCFHALPCTVYCANLLSNLKLLISYNSYYERRHIAFSETLNQLFWSKQQQQQADDNISSTQSRRHFLPQRVI